MSETPWTRLESLPPEIGLLVNEICMRFESVWRQGRWPRIEEYLGDAPEPARPVLLRELVLLDVEYRRQKGEAPSADDYRRLFLSGAPGWLARELADLSDRDDWPRIPGYEVLGRLGAGGMGVVYKARQFAPNRLVALKRMKPTDPQHEAEARQRFRLEAEAAARLRHPGIVEIYEVGEHDGCPYFSMELIENGSLDARLKSGPLPPRQAAEVVEKVARAVQAAHQAGIVHRDLKPANVLLAEVGGEATPTVAGHLPTQEGASAPVTSRSFEPRITDFGLARKLDAEGPSQTGALLGTPQYMAPEQVRGEKMITAAADVYSLGVVLYECLTGRPPFAAPTPVDLFVAVLNDEPVPVRRLQPRVERDLETICHRCLRKEPGKRYGSALEVAEDLRRLQEGRPIEARPVGAIERGAKWVRRNPVVAALAAAILLVVATGATVATVFGVMEKQARGRAELEAGEKGKALGKAQENEQKAKAASDKAKERAEEAEMGRHGFMMTAAWQAWQQNDLRMAEAILREVPEKLRQTWEFRHVRGLCQRKAMTLRGHTDGVNGVAYSPDGSRLASAGDDRTLKVWDAKTGQHLLTLEGHTNSVRAVAYGPDGTRIASGDRGDGTLKVWDASTGKHLLTLEGHTECVWSVAFSPDGTRIASASQDKTLKVWDARTGKVLLTLRGHTGSVTAVAFSPDGKRIASASLDKTLKVWDARTGKVLLTLKGSALAVAYSPDGKRIASGTRDWTLKVWDAATGQNLLTLKGHTNSVSAVAYSPDGTRLASGSLDGAVKVWDARTGQEVLTFKGHSGSVTAVAYSPDGSRIASGSSDKTLKVWDASTSQDLLTLEGHRGSVTAVAYSPDGSRIASGGLDRGLKVWDARTWRSLLTLEGHRGTVTAMAYSPDGTRIASASQDKTLKVWDARTGRELFTLEGHTKEVFAVAYSPDGSRIASGSLDGKLKVWDAKTGHDLLTLEGHMDGVTAVAYSPDGSRIASASQDKTLKVWDARTGQDLLTLRGHANGVSAVAYSPDGSRIASGSIDQTLRVWAAHTGQNLLTLRGHTHYVNAVAYSPDGTRLASAGPDGKLKVWDVKTGHDLLTLEGHKGGVSAVAYSPDGSRIASGSWDMTLKVFDARTSQDLFTLRGHADGVSAVAYSPDGSRLASGSWDATLKVWDARTWRPLLTLEGHTGRVTAVAYSPDGSRIASASQDKTLKVWDARTGKALLTLRGHANSVTAVAYSPDGKCIFGEDVNGKVFAWDVTDGKPLPDAPSTMPTPSRLSVAHGDRRAYTEGNLVRIERLLSADEWSHWHLDEGRIEAELRASRDRESHASEAERMKWIDPFGATFHLDRLLALSPDERPRLIRQRTDVLASVLRNGGDPWATREIARHLIGDPGSVSNPAYRRYLLGRLAVQQRAPLDRLYGVLLLRTGNAQDAALVFRAAIRNRAHDQPPIDELLLALALLDLDRRDEARQYLKTAADWMDNGTASLRLTAILGSRPAGPLAALAAVAHVPDVRLNPLDPFTAHELYTLRREAERALAE